MLTLQLYFCPKKFPQTLQLQLQDDRRMVHSVGGGCSFGPKETGIAQQRFEYVECTPVESNVDTMRLVYNAFAQKLEGVR
eukprot:685349-Amphidinium_carterae.1